MNANELRRIRDLAGSIENRAMICLDTVRLIQENVELIQPQLGGMVSMLEELDQVDAALCRVREHFSMLSAGASLASMPCLIPTFKDPTPEEVAK